MEKYTSHLIKSNATIKDALIAINKITNQILSLFVIDDNMQLVGTLTDGDIRRALVIGSQLSESVRLAMNSSFKSINCEKVDPYLIKSYRNSGIKLLPALDKDGKILKIYNLVEKQSILPIDAVLMAGGKGERLKPLTDETPKPLLKVGSKPIIDYNIELLLKFGVENINVTVNYLAEQIETHFAKDRDGIKVKCIREPRYLGTMGSIKLIPKFYNDSILIMNSDLFTNIDLEDFYNTFIDSGAEMAVAAVPYSFAVPYGVFDLDENSIKGLREKPTYNYYANGGIYLIKRSLLEIIPNDLFFDATDFIELILEQGYKVTHFPIIGYWIDIGKPEDFKKVQEYAKHLQLT